MNTLYETVAGLMSDRFRFVFVGDNHWQSRNFQKKMCHVLGQMEFSSDFLRCDVWIISKERNRSKYMFKRLIKQYIKYNEN